MYAGAIRLVGTEQGVGVKLAGNMAASAGDIQIDADGKLSLAQTATAGNLRIKAAEVALEGPTYAAGSAEVSAQGSLSNAQSLAAGSKITLQAANISNAGTVESGVNTDGSRNGVGDLAVRADALQNSGALVAGRQADISVQTHLDNRGGVVSASDVQLRAQTVDNRQGAVLGERTVQVSAQSLDNRERGLIQSRDVLSLQLRETLDNSLGQLLALGRIDLQAGQWLNQGGEFFAQQGGELQVGSLDNRQGTIASGAQLGIHSQQDILNQGGQLSAQGDLRLDAQLLNNREGGRVTSQGALSLNLRELNNNGGWVQSAGEQMLNAARIENFGGYLLSLGQLHWNGQQLDTRGGAIRSVGDLQLDGTSVLNHDGDIATDGNFRTSVLELQQHQGSIIANGTASLLASAVENSQDSLIASRQGLDLQSFQITNVQGGELASQGSLGLRTDLLDNRNGGRIDSTDDFALRANRILNQAGILSSGGRLDVLGTLLDNRNGGLVVSSEGMSLRLSEQLQNQGGRVSTGAELLLVAPAVDNSANGQIGVAGAATLKDADIDSLNTGKWVAENATQYNYLEHKDVKALDKDMGSCSGSEVSKCQEDKWKAGGYDAESLANLNDAMQVSGPLVAKYKLEQVAGSLDALLAMPCSTSVCEGYKATLVERALKSYVHLSDVVGEWAPSMDRFSLMAGGAVGGRSDTSIRPAGTPTPAGLTQFEKAVEYWSGVRAEVAAATRGAATTERAALPAGYREGSSAGSAFSETAGLPDGYRRVINTKTGNTEVLASDGKLYLETGNGLQPKAGGNLAGLVEAEKNIALKEQASKITAPIDFDGHIVRAEVKPNGNVVGGHSTVTGDVRVIPGTESAPNAQGVYSAKIEVVNPSSPGSFLPKTNNGGVSTMFPKSWSADRIKVEVDAAFQSKTVIGNKWTGTTPSGVKVEGYLSPKTTVYPKL